MEEVWHQEKATVRDVMDALNKSASKSRAYTTVMTIMDRLHRKGLLDRTQGRNNTYIYTARLARDEYADVRAQAEVDALVQEWGDVALVHFAKQMGTLDPKRREQLRRLARGA